MLGFCWHAMLVFEQPFLDTTWHGYVKSWAVKFQSNLILQYGLPVQSTVGAAMENF
jgi:hypothetical protein